MPRGYVVMTEVIHDPAGMAAHGAVTYDSLVEHGAKMLVVDDHYASVRHPAKAWGAPESLVGQPVPTHSGPRALGATTRLARSHRCGDGELVVRVLRDETRRNEEVAVRRSDPQRMSPPARLGLVPVPSNFG